MSAGSTASASCPTPAPPASEAKTLLAAANRVLRGEIAARARRLAAAPDGEFALGARRRRALARRRGRRGCSPATSALAPRVEALPGDFLEGELRDGVRRRLADFLRAAHRARARRRCSRRARPSSSGRRAASSSSSPRRWAACPARAVTTPARGAAPAATARRWRGSACGSAPRSVYVDAAAASRSAARLARAALGGGARRGAAAGPGGIAAPRDPAVSARGLRGDGCRVLGPRVLRVDRVERLAAAARRLGAARPVRRDAGAGAARRRAPPEELAAMLPALGYRAVPRRGRRDVSTRAAPRPASAARASQRGGAASRRAAQADGPFAKLKELRLAR